MAKNQRDEPRRVDADQSPVGVNVWAQCEGYRCLAYRAADGRWLGAFSHQELKNVIRIYPLG